RAGQRVRSNFEGLTRRAVTLTVAMLVALFAATRLPIGENPILLSAVPWLLGAVGTAWFTSPIDEPERLQGQALMIAAVAVVILIAVPADPLTAGVAGAMALMPTAGARGRIPGRVRSAFSGVLLLTAAGSAVPPVRQARASRTWGARVQAVAVGLGLVMMLFAARAGMLRVLVLPATTLLVMLFLPSLSPSNAVRFQWVAALGAALLIARPLLSTLTGESPKDAIRDRLLAGLLLLAIGARDSFGLGELAVILLLIDLA